jgi:hypothetical protein
MRLDDLVDQSFRTVRLRKRRRRGEKQEDSYKMAKS